MRINGTRNGMAGIQTGQNNIGDPNVSRVPADSLYKILRIPEIKIGYETGPFENYGSFAIRNYKILASSTGYISQKHKFSLRFNTVRSTNDQLVNGTSAPNPRASSNRVSNNAMSFKNTNYGFLNTGQLTFGRAQQQPFQFLDEPASRTITLYRIQEPAT